MSMCSAAAHIIMHESDETKRVVNILISCTDRSAAVVQERSKRATLIPSGVALNHFLSHKLNVVSVYVLLLQYVCWLSMQAPEEIVCVLEISESSAAHLITNSFGFVQTKIHFFYCFDLRFTWEWKCKSEHLRLEVWVCTLVSMKRTSTGYWENERMEERNAFNSLAKKELWKT